jgi:hypothetical protein
MSQPRFFLAYAPRGAGLRCALAYLESGRDVYGWFAGPRDDTTVARCYFLLEDLHAAKAPRYDAVHETDLHSAWSLDEARRHELAQMQEAFSREWLFYRGDPGAERELQAYAEAELAAGAINVRFERLAKFDTRQPNWTHYSPKFERTVLRHLSGRWPLEFRLHGDERAPRRAAGPRP